MSRQTQVVAHYREGLNQPLKITSNGYMLVGNDECIAFYFDTDSRAWVEASSYTDEDYPCVYILGAGEEEDMLEVSFPEFKGWRYHSSSGGKSIGICLVNRAKER